MVLGLGTRAAALVIVVNLDVAFYFVLHMAVRQEHVELVLIYLAGFLTLMFAGASRRRKAVNQQQTRLAPARSWQGRRRWAE